MAHPAEVSNKRAPEQHLEGATKLQRLADVENAMAYIGPKDGRISWSKIIPEIGVTLTDILVDAMKSSPNATPRYALSYMSLRLRGTGNITVQKISSRIQQLRIMRAIAVPTAPAIPASPTASEIPTAPASPTSPTASEMPVSSKGATEAALAEKVAAAAARVLGAEKEALQACASAVAQDLVKLLPASTLSPEGVQGYMAGLMASTGPGSISVRAAQIARKLLGEGRGMEHDFKLVVLTQAFVSMLEEPDSEMSEVIAAVAQNKNVHASAVKLVSAGNADMLTSYVGKQVVCRWDKNPKGMRWCCGVVRKGSGTMPFDIKYDDGEVEGVAFPEKSIYFFTV